MREHLLTPSLSGNSRPSVSIYSTNASIVVGFCGGAPAVILLSALNSYRLKRPFDLLAYAAATVAWLSMVHASLHAPAIQPLDWLFRTIGVRNTSSLLAILLCGGFYALHRTEHRASTMFQSPPKPWIPGIACILLSWGISTITVAIFDTAGGA